ncbi:type II secretion system F family protein [Sulfurimonas sp. SAG-AH-194-I05]|nr:type II secretion system F family protein [Sulfurimonas sp. SAG-AH-194-I05]MDF1875394.1 type II secretion system F family protein [Sulfurimonas sp. SAG-AH-194-I05]
MIFSYKGFTTKGETVSATITADSLADAKEILQHNGILLEKIKEQRSFFTPKIPNSELVIVCRNLSIYLKSSIPLYQALALLKNSYEGNKKMLLWLDALINALKSGATFFEALEGQTIFKMPQFFLYTVKVSEKSSSLAPTLKELSEFMNGIERIKKEVTKAFVYPGFIILVSIALINFMLTNIVPNIVEMFTSMGNELPPSTQFTLDVSNFLQNYGMYLLLFLIGSFSGMGYLFAQQGKFRLRVDMVLLKVPLVKTILMNYELGRFCSVTALLLKNGVPFAQTMNFSSKIFSNTLLQKVFESISAQIVEGRSFFDAVKSQDMLKLPPDFLSAIAIGEDSSELPSTLTTLSEFYEENNKDKIAILLSLMEPVLMVFVGGVIGFLVISMLLPIFSMSIQ